MSKPPRFWSRRWFLRRSSSATLCTVIPAVLAKHAVADQTGTNADPATTAASLATIQASHPRLHFDALGRRLIVDRSRSTHQQHTERLLDWVKRHRNWLPPRELPDTSGNEVLLEEAGCFVTNAALASVLSDEASNLRLAKRWTLAMCELPRSELRNYGLGIYAAGLARAYDWLFEHWTADEREQIRGHIGHLVRQVYAGSFPDSPERRWWSDAHLHHDFWIPVGGYGEAALALLGEIDEASAWAARAKHLLDVSLSWLGNDGAWHEGAADWCYTLAPLLWFYGAWSTAVGEDLHRVPWLRNTAAYRLYHWLPDNSYVYLNDSFRSGRYNTSGSAASHILRRLAGLFSDGRAQWLADRDEQLDLNPQRRGVYQAPYEQSSIRPTRHEYREADSQCAAWNVLWYDRSVPAVPPDRLTTARHFENMGVTIMRTGWGSRDAVASLACGPLAGHRCAERMRAGESRSTANYSHAHADYGSFSLFADGEYFVVPAGYARRSSHFQNTVSVNGADLLVDPTLDLRILGMTVDEDRGISCAVADATAGFPPHLEVERYHRHLLLSRSGHCLVFDDLKLATRRTRTWNQFQWSIHSDPSVHRVATKGSQLEWHSLGSDTARMRLQVYEPQAFAWEHAKLSSTDGEPLLETHRLVRPEWYSDRMQVLAAMSWGETGQAPTLLRHSDFLALLVDDGLAIGFALRPLSRSAAGQLTHGSLRNRELLLFGWNREDPVEPMRIGARG